jgi:uncharacterized protein YbaR (Trm112 family)
MKVNFEDLLARYARGENIIQHLKANHPGLPLAQMIEISYDLQSGSYIKQADENGAFLEAYTRSVANVLAPLRPATMMEVGCGEATTLGNVARHMGPGPGLYGFDISFSRLLYARSYLERLQLPHANTLFMGDLFNIPMGDNAVDVVYTSHSIEPNGGREEEALRELYRVSGRYLVLLEPGYEFASAAAQARMESHGYVRNLGEVARRLGYEVLEHRPFEHSANPLNPTALLVIRKSVTAAAVANPFRCPMTHHQLRSNDGSFMTTVQPGYVYPVIRGIPCLLENKAILASHIARFS